METMLKCMLAIYLNHIEFEKNNLFWLYSLETENLKKEILDKKAKDTEEMVRILSLRWKGEEVQSDLDVSFLYKDMLYFVSDYVSKKIKEEQAKSDQNSPALNDLNQVFSDITGTFEGLRKRKLV